MATVALTQLVAVHEFGPGTKPTTSALQRFRLLMGALPTSRVVASSWAQSANQKSL